MVNPNYKAQRINKLIGSKSYPHTHLKVTSNDGLATVYVKTKHFSVKTYEVISYITKERNEWLEDLNKWGDTTNKYIVSFSNLNDAKKYAQEMIKFQNNIFDQKRIAYV